MSTTTSRPIQISTTTSRPVTFKPITEQQANQTCWQAFMNNSALSAAINSGCLDFNLALQFCILDLTVD